MTARLWYAYAAASAVAGALMLGATAMAVVTLPSPQASPSEVVAVLSGAMFTLVLARVAVAFRQKGKAADEHPGGAE